MSTLVEESNASSAQQRVSFSDDEGEDPLDALVSRKLSVASGASSAVTTKTATSGRGGSSIAGSSVHGVTSRDESLELSTNSPSSGYYGSQPLLLSSQPSPNGSCSDPSSTSSASSMDVTSDSPTTTTVATMNNINSVVVVSAPQPPDIIEDDLRMSSPTMTSSGTSATISYGAADHLLGSPVPTLDTDDTRSTTNTSGSTHDSAPEWITVGTNVRVAPDGKPGVVAFVGHTHFSSGLWVGVSLESAHGKNDGSVEGVAYFQSRPKHGLFVRAEKLKPDVAARGRAQRKSSSATSGAGHPTASVRR